MNTSTKVLSTALHKASSFTCLSLADTVHSRATGPKNKLVLYLSQVVYFFYVQMREIHLDTSNLQYVQQRLNACEVKRIVKNIKTVKPPFFWIVALGPGMRTSPHASPMLWTN
jgi:hypothetical protein